MARKPINRWLRCARAARAAIRIEWRRTPMSAGFFLTSFYPKVPPSGAPFVSIQSLGGAGGGGGGATFTGGTYTFSTK